MRTTYVSSEVNKYKQQKLNNVIQSLSDYVSCTTNDCTNQIYGTIDYCGYIYEGQVISGDKKPRRQDVPIKTTNNIFLGYLDNNGNLTVSNVQQTCGSSNNVDKSYCWCAGWCGCCTSDYECCYQVSCDCFPTCYYNCEIYEVAQTDYCIIDCYIKESLICNNIDAVSCIRYTSGGQSPTWTNAGACFFVCNVNNTSYLWSCNIISGSYFVCQQIATYNCNTCDWDWEAVTNTELVCNYVQNCLGWCVIDICSEGALGAALSYQTTYCCIVNCVCYVDATNQEVCIKERYL